MSQLKNQKYYSDINCYLHQIYFLHDCDNSIVFVRFWRTNNCVIVCRRCFNDFRSSHQFEEISEKKFNSYQKTKILK